jgi:hypothetical protein
LVRGDINGNVDFSLLFSGNSVSEIGNEILNCQYFMEKIIFPSLQ